MSNFILAQRINNLLTNLETKLTNEVNTKEVSLIPLTEPPADVSNKLYEVNGFLFYNGFILSVGGSTDVLSVNFQTPDINTGNINLTQALSPFTMEDTLTCQENVLCEKNLKINNQLEVDGISLLQTQMITPLATISTGDITTLNTTTGNIITLDNTTTGNITTLNTTTGNITTLNTTTGNITTLNTTTGNITTLDNTTTGNITTLNTTNGNITTLNTTTGNITTLNTTNGNIINLNDTINASIENITDLQNVNGEPFINGTGLFSLTDSTISNTAGTILNFNNTLTTTTLNSTNGNITNLIATGPATINELRSFSVGDIGFLKHKDINDNNEYCIGQDKTSKNTFINCGDGSLINFRINNVSNSGMTLNSNGNLDVIGRLKTGTTELFTLDGNSTFRNINNSYGIIQRDDGQTLINSDNDKTLLFRLNNSNQMGLTATGLGVKLTNPDAKLHILGGGFADFSDFRIGTATNYLGMGVATGGGGAGNSFIQTIGTGTKYLLLNPEGNRVGINTGSPSQPLDVAGNARINDMLLGNIIGETFQGFRHNSLSTNEYAIVQDSIGRTFLNSKASQNIFFRNNNNDIMTLSSAGILNITNMLNCNGNDNASAISINIGASQRKWIGSDGSEFNSIVYDKARGQIFNSTSNLYFNMDSNNTDTSRIIQFSTNRGSNSSGSVIMTLAEDNLNVKIGTTSGSEKLEVNGNLNITGDYLINGTPIVPTGSKWLSSGDDIYYNNGNVGILTGSTILAPLHINGNQYFTWSSSRRILMDNTPAGAGNINNYRQGIHYNGTTRDLEVFSTSGDSGGGIKFYTDNNVASGQSDDFYGTEKMSIDADGNVSILGNIDIQGNYLIDGEEIISDPVSFSTLQPGISTEYRDVVYTSQGYFGCVSFQGGSNNALYMISADGRRWIQISTPTEGGTFNNNRFQSITGGPDNTMVACLGGGGGTIVPKIMLSTDNGFNWTQLGPDNDNQLNSITYSKKLSRWVAVGQQFNDRIWISDDGTNWTRYSLPSTRTWTGICWGLNEFVAVSADASTTGIITSPSGLNGSWTFQTCPAGNWRGICYGDGIYCAVGDSVIATSNNGGVTWVQQSNPVGNNFRSVAFGDGIFVAVSNNGSNNRAIYSKDLGVTWHVLETANHPWLSITYGNGRFVAVASNSNVMISGKIRNPPYPNN
jgi:hypothetical protein